MLKATIAPIHGSFETQQLVKVKVVLTNTGDEDLQVLKRDTPLDEILTDCLMVKRNGKEVEYDGPIVKRAAPTASEYVLVKAGQSVEAEYEVSHAYDTSKQGTYEVELKTPVQDARPKAAKLAAALKSPAFAPQKHALEGKAGFRVVKGPNRRPTLGEAARSKEAKKKATKAPTAALKKKSAGKKKATAKVAQALNPTFSGGNTNQKADAKQAHFDGYQLCVAALAGLVNGAKYVEWFGTHTSARFNKVKNNYTAVKTKLETLIFTYDLTGTGCGGSVYAYTYKGTTTIWFCDLFWSAPANGTDSKAGTVLHEHTHSDASTDDHRYGQVSCRALANSDPGKAVENADSHEYYAGG